MIKTPYQLLTDHNSNNEIGLPSGEDFGDFLSEFGRGLYKHVRRFKGNETYGIVNSPIGDQRALDKLKKIGFNDSRDLVVLSAVAFDDYADEVFKLLDKQLIEMIDIEKRLYRPLINQLASLITNPELFNKAWLDKEIRFVNTDKYKKELGKMFKPQRDAVGDPEETSFKDLYKSPDNFKDCTKLLVDIKDTGTRIDIPSLISAEKRLVELVNEFVEDYDPDEQPLHKSIKKMMIEMTVAIGKETEYLSALLYYGNIFIVAHNDSIKRIESL